MSFVFFSSLGESFGESDFSVVVFGDLFFLLTGFSVVAIDLLFLILILLLFLFCWHYISLLLLFFFLATFFFTIFFTIVFLLLHIIKILLSDLIKHLSNILDVFSKLLLQESTCLHFFVKVNGSVDVYFQSGHAVKFQSIMLGKINLNTLDISMEIVLCVRMRG
jgi:hypothetical protein